MSPAHRGHLQGFAITFTTHEMKNQGRAAQHPSPAHHSPTAMGERGLHEGDGEEHADAPALPSRLLLQSFPAHPPCPNAKSVFTMALKGGFQHKQGMRRHQTQGIEDLLRWRMLCACCLWMPPLHLSPVWPFWTRSCKPKLPPSSS